MPLGAARDFRDRQTLVPGDGNTKALPVDRDGNAYATDVYYDDASGTRQSLRATIAGGGGTTVSAGTNIGVTGGPAYTVSVVNSPTFSGTVTAAGITTAGTLSAGGNTYPVGAAAVGQILQASAPGVFSLAQQVTLTAGANMNIGVGPAYTVSTVNNPVFGSVVTSGGFTTAGTTTTGNLSTLGNATITGSLTASGNAYPLTAAAAGRFIQGTAANTYENSAYALPTAVGASGTLLRSNGTDYAVTAYTVPATAGASGTFLQSNGTNLVTTPYKLPTAVGTSGTLLQSNGTDVVNTSVTYPTGTGTTGYVLTLTSASAAAWQQPITSVPLIVPAFANKSTYNPPYPDVSHVVFTPQTSLTGAEYVTLNVLGGDAVPPAQPVWVEYSVLGIVGSMILEAILHFTNIVANGGTMTFIIQVNGVTVKTIDKNSTGRSGAAMTNDAWTDALLITDAISVTMTGNDTIRFEILNTGAQTGAWSVDLVRFYISAP